MFVDDGAVFYLNGSLVNRLRITNNPVVYSTLAELQPVEGVRETISIPASALRVGTNWLAVEVHQNVATSSDMVFALSLVATRTVPVTNFSSVILSEILADNTGVTNADGTVTDWVEISNPTSNTYTLENCSLSDDPTAPRRWVFPPGASLAPGARLLVRCDSASAATMTNGPVLNTGFGLNITTLDKTMGGLADDTVTIYRGAPKTQKTINPGDFITTDAQLARDYAGTGHVISQKVRKKDILDDMLEPLGGEYIYRPAK